MGADAIGETMSDERTGKGPDSGEKQILKLLDGFLESKVLMTAFELDVFTLLERERLPMAAALERLSLPARAGSILLNACLAVGLLDIDDAGRLGTAPHVAPWLRRGDAEPFRVPTYLIDYYRAVYGALVDLGAVVKSDGESAEFRLRDYFKDDVSAIDPAIARDYSAYMDATMASIAEVVIDTYPFSGHQKLVDLCGGPGTFAAAVARATPGLRVGFVDVPAVIDYGRELLAKEPAELAARVEAVPGDAFQGELPRDADIFTMCRSAHDWDDDRMSALAGRVHAALPPGGKLLIIERMLPDHFDPAARALYLRAMYFLVKSPTARYRSKDEYRAMLTRAGFSRVSMLEPSRRPYAFFPGLVIAEAIK
jgi:demethylspheroidene O-methyltransferase